MGFAFRFWHPVVVATTGVLVFLAVAATQHYALNNVVALTDARKGMRQLVVSAAGVEVDLLDLAHVHDMSLLADEVPRRGRDYAIAERRFLHSVNELEHQLAAVPGLAPRALELVRALRAGRQRTTANLAPPSVQLLADAQLTQVRDQVHATRQWVTEARAGLAGLTGQLYQLIDDRDRGVRQWQQRADWAGGVLAMVGVLLLLLGYGLLWGEHRQRRRAEATLEAYRDHLEQAVRQRTAELEASHAQLRVMTRHIRDSVETERKRLAREVHDQLGQVLTTLKMHVHSRFPADPSLADCLSLLDQAIHISRRIAADLRPPLLDDLGLGAALKQLAQQTGVVTQVRVDDDQALASDQAVQLFRIAQEAITNVLRHACAERLRIEGGAAGEHYLLMIEDDGVGFDPTTVRREALGLLGMHERAYLAGGECRWLRPRYGGTRVEIRLPLTDKEAVDACAAG